MVDDRTTVALRELLEQRLEFERALVSQRFEALDKHLRQHFEMVEKALMLQALEYERRLTVLNHAHESAVKEQARVLPREMFDAFKREYDIFKTDAEKQLQAISTRSLTLTTVIGFIFAAISILIRFWPV